MLDPALQETLLIVVYIGIAVGFLGQAIPFFPSLQLIWLSVLGYGLLTGFSWRSEIVFAAITLIMLVGSLIEQVLMSAGARQRGASWLTLVVSFLVLLIGSFLWTPIGGLAASFIAVFLIEFVRLKDAQRALNSTKGMAIGCGWSMVTRIGINSAIVGLWLFWLLWLK